MSNRTSPAAAEGPLPAVRAGAPGAPSARQALPALALMVASGLAGLGYQIVWTQQATAWLGHEAPAVLAVVTAFFGGLALGALVLGSRIERSRRPAHWYAGCELLIAGWSVSLVFLIGPISAWLLAATGAQPSAAWQSAVAFVGTFLVLLPATAAMGATLPAMSRVLALWWPAGRALAALYACNTAGAVLGVLAAAFWAVPEFGLARTALACAGLNLLCAAAAWTLPLPRSGARALPAAPAPGSASATAPASGGGLPVLAATGLLGIGYEVLVVRVLSQVTEDTVYTFAMLLAVYLVGTALGAAAYQRWLTAQAAVPAARRRGPAGVRNALLAAVAAACLLGTLSLWAAEDLRDAVQRGLGAYAGGGMAAALAAEAVLALVAFALPTLVMGALFSHLALQAREAGTAFGRALGVNTLGAAAAPLLFGVVAVPWLGAKGALLLVPAGYLLLMSPWRPAAAGIGVAALAVAVLAVAWRMPPLAFIEVPEGGRVLSYREGAMAAVSVVEDADGVARLRINNRQQEGSSATLLTDARQALLPLLLHPQPRRVLFLGLGTGVTASSAAQDPGLQVDVAELLPEVIEASTHFTKALLPSAPGVSSAPAPRLRAVAADARRFVRVSSVHYDVIVSDNFHPARSGSGALYTVEHFQAVRDRLAGGGLFCQWLPLHQLDLDTLRSIVRSFQAVYPSGWAMLATNSLETPVLGLVARANGAGFDLAQARARLAGTTLPQHLPDFGLADEWALFGGFVAGPQALARWSAGADLNTDDRPVVAYRAPRITYAPDSLPRERLQALLGQVDIAPAELLASDSDADAGRRLAAYWAARDDFIAIGQQVRPTGDVQQLLAQVRDPLLSVLRTSPDFRPAYDPLLRMAGALGRSDAPAARRLLHDLARVQPARAEAGEQLRAIGAAP